MQGKYLPLLSIPLFSFLALAQAQMQVSFNSTLKDYDFRGIVPLSSISKQCGEAYAAPVRCTDHLFKLRDNEKGPKMFSNRELSRFCTTECIESLNRWDMNLQESCTDGDRLVVEDPTRTAPYLTLALKNRRGIQENMYWMFCLKDMFSSKEDDFCLPKNDRLPSWPPADSKNTTGAGASATTEFCKSSCRTQQSHLMHRAARHHGYNLIDMVDAGQICPGVDTSVFPVSITMLAAFGSSADPPPASSVMTISGGGQIEGTEYTWNFYKTEFAAATRNAAGCLKHGMPWTIGITAVGALLHL